jgi:uncharacterized protein YgiM (DUF1202 family)
MAKREMKKNEAAEVNVETPVAVEEAVTPVEEEKKEVIGIVTGCSRLNVRKAPKSGSDVVTIIDKDTKVTIVDIEKASGEWYKVKIDNETSGFDGYCMKKFIKLV